METGAVDLATDAGRRSGWLADLVGAGADRGRGGPRWAVLPSAARPRVLVPLGAPRAAAAVLDRDTGLGGRARRVAALALRAGALPPGVGGRLRGGSAGFGAWLGQVLDEDGLLLGVTIGPPRPNRKAVVQAVRADGTTVAWAKVACSPLTRQLVVNEGRWLARVADSGLPGIEVPGVIATERWHDHDVLVTAPLADRPASDAFAVTPDLVGAVASLDDGGSHRLEGSPWWQATDGRIAALGTTRTRAVLGDALESLGRGHDDLTWPFGALHGDLTRWNARRCGDTTQVWDWERAAAPRPFGLDAAHEAFQTAQVVDGLAVPAAAAAADARVGPLLVEAGLDPLMAPAVVTAYLMERRLRWHEDAALGSTTEGTARHDAILDEISARVGRGVPQP